MASRITEDGQVAMLPVLRDVLASEGHVADWPLFALHPKVARPTKPHPDGRLGDDGKVLRVRDLDPARYRREVELHSRDPATGKERVERCVIVCNSEYGWPDDVAQRVTYALIRLWNEQRRADDPRVYVSRKELCREAGLGTGGNAIRRLEGALRAMKAQHIELFNAYMEKVAGDRRLARVPGGKTVTLVAAWNWSMEGKSRGRAAFLGDLGRVPVTIEAVPGLPHVELGRNLFESLRSRYLQPADGDYANLLTPLERRLYYLLNKRMGHDKWVWECSVARLAVRLPINGDHVERDLGEALEGLTRPREVGGRTVRFLEAYKFSGTGDRRKVSIYFYGRSPVAELRRNLQGGGAAADGADPEPNEDA